MPRSQPDWGLDRPTPTEREGWAFSEKEQEEILAIVGLRAGTEQSESLLVALNEGLVEVYCEQEQVSTTVGQKTAGLSEIAQVALDLANKLEGNRSGQEFLFDILRAQLSPVFAALIDRGALVHVLRELEKAAEDVTLYYSGHSRERVPEREDRLAIVVAEAMLGADLRVTAMIEEIGGDKSAYELGPFGALLEWCLGRHEENGAPARPTVYQRTRYALAVTKKRVRSRKPRNKKRSE